MHLPLNSPGSLEIEPYIERIRQAAEQRTPLRIRGGGSKDFYGALDVHHAGMTLPGDVLDTTGLSGVVSYEPSELVVTVGAGTRLDALEALLAEHGQCLPFEPPHFHWSGDPAERGATVGGMGACALAGPARASVGGVRDYVLGLHLINGRGEHLTFGGQVMKNVAGYDISRLMAGAMGTLGLMTEISLKVLPVAPAEATLAFELDQPLALEQLHRWGGQPLPLNASCWVDNARGLDAPGEGDGAFTSSRERLVVRLRGAVAAVEAASQRMLADVSGQRVDTAAAQVNWAECRNQRLPFFTAPQASGMGLWRLSLPQTAPVLQGPWEQLVEWHGALRWLWAPVEAREELSQWAQSVGGNATLFVANHLDSTGPKAIKDVKNQSAQVISQRLKAAFDPLGIFNPGRMAAGI